MAAWLSIFWAQIADRPAYRFTDVFIPAASALAAFLIAYGAMKERMKNRDRELDKLRDEFDQYKKEQERAHDREFARIKEDLEEQGRQLAVLIDRSDRDERIGRNTPVHGTPIPGYRQASPMRPRQDTPSSEPPLTRPKKPDR